MGWANGAGEPGPGSCPLDCLGSQGATCAPAEEVRAPHPPRGAAPAPGHVVRYAVHATPPIPITEAVVLGEQARVAALGRYGHLTGGGSAVLSARGPEGPLAGHRHAFYQPADEDGDGWIEHLTLYAPAGLSVCEAEVLASLDRL